MLPNRLLWRTLDVFGGCFGFLLEGFACQPKLFQAGLFCRVRFPALGDMSLDPAVQRGSPLLAAREWLRFRILSQNSASPRGIATSIENRKLLWGRGRQINLSYLLMLATGTPERLDLKMGSHRLMRFAARQIGPAAALFAFGRVHDFPPLLGRSVIVSLVPSRPFSFRRPKARVQLNVQLKRGGREGR